MNSYIILDYLFNLADNHSTLILVIVTVFYTALTYKLSSESRYERRYQYLQKRLENLYYPLKDVFNSRLNLSFRIKPEGKRGTILIGNQKGPEILRCMYPDLKLEYIKPYLYMSPPILKNLFNCWANEVSVFEDPENIWSEEEITDRCNKIEDIRKDLIKEMNSCIEKDEEELYFIANGLLKSYLKRIKDRFKI
jgi:hypothetical protein